jgi:hypothetical protein
MAMMGGGGQSAVGMQTPGGMAMPGRLLGNYSNTPPMMGGGGQSQVGYQTPGAIGMPAPGMPPAQMGTAGRSQVGYQTPGGAASPFSPATPYGAPASPFSPGALNQQRMMGSILGNPYSTSMMNTKPPGAW